MISRHLIRAVEHHTVLTKSTFSIALNDTLWTIDILERPGTSRCRLDASLPRQL
jgi:hypothetical protein